MSTTAIVIIVVALVAIAAVVFFSLAKRRSHRLRDRFGPEYEREVRETGSTRRAEQHLELREKRVKTFNIRPLLPADRRQFAQSWTHLQGRFVDDPKGAVTDAYLLVAQVMAARGYPVADFETNAADLSVDHPLVVENYRAAHVIAQQHARGQATTENLRQAMIHYRTLFDDLLGQAPSARAASA